MAKNVNFPTYGFINDQLALNEENWRKFFKPFVYDSVQSGLVTTAGTGMTVNVSGGECRCGAVMGVLDGTISLDIDAGHATYNRIDSIVVQYTYGAPSTLSIAVKRGQASANPTPPILSKVYNTLWEMEIAQIFIPSGATSASALTITDKRVIYESIEDAAGDIIISSSTEPTSPINKIWFKDEADDEYTVPTNTEFTELEQDVADLKNSKNKLQNYIYTGLYPEITNNLIDLQSPNIIENHFLSGLTGLVENTSYRITDYIRVMPGQDYKFIALYGGGWYVWYDKDFIGISGNKTNTIGNDRTITAPNNAYYFRVSAYKTDSPVFIESDYNVGANRNPIVKIHNLHVDDKSLDSYTIGHLYDIVYMENIANPSEIESGYISYQTGNIVASENYYASGYIPIYKGVMYMYRGSSGNFAFYFGDKTFLGANGNNITIYDGGTIKGFTDNLNNTYFVSPIDGFIRVSSTDYNATFIAITSSDVDTTTISPNNNNSYSLPIEPKLPPDYRRKIYINASEGILSFYNKMLFAYTTGNCDVYIGYGDYIYTNSLVESIRSSGKRGIPIGNNCKYFFETGANIYCEYTGSRAADVVDLFSPLDSQNTSGNYEIYNLHLISKNTCYALHDEVSGQDKFCRHIYKNCHIELDNSALGTDGNSLSKALGGGLGKHEEVIIENCYFKAINPSKSTSVQNDVSYHGAINSTFTDAKIVVTGCYFENLLRTSEYSYATDGPWTKITYSNNKSGYSPQFDDKQTVLQWNNVISN